MVRAGAISNTGSGSILFKGMLTMDDNFVDVSGDDEDSLPRTDKTFSAALVVVGTSA